MGNFEGLKGNRFFLAQPQLLWDFGKPLTFTPGKLYAGFEYQNRVQPLPHHGEDGKRAPGHAPLEHLMTV